MRKELRDVLDAAEARVLSKPDYLMSPEVKQELDRLKQEQQQNQKQKRSTQGRANKAAGDSFETWINGQHDAALQMGLIAHCEHHEPHARMLKGRLVYVRPGVSDYSLITVQGIAGAVEAKSTSASRLDRKEVKPAQARHLTACGVAGGLALLLVEFRQGGVKNRYAIPWLSIEWKVLRSAESVAEDDLKDWRIPPGVCYLARFVKPCLEIAQRVRALSPPSVLGRKFARE